MTNMACVGAIGILGLTRQDNSNAHATAAITLNRNGPTTFPLERAYGSGSARQVRQAAARSPIAM